jgi:hypothetical protein
MNFKVDERSRSMKDDPLPTVRIQTDVPNEEPPPILGMP